MAWTYLLECADGSFYVGSTIDLDRRLGQHAAGEGAAYTRPRRRRPVRLRWCGQFERVEEAFRFEKQVQGWSRAKRIALIESRWHDLPELASRPVRTSTSTTPVGPPGFEAPRQRSSHLNPPGVEVRGPPGPSLETPPPRHHLDPDSRPTGFRGSSPALVTPQPSGMS
ncbi:MAG: GIY-YIG nuclease family protein [Nocardioides sp.]